MRIRVRGLRTAEEAMQMINYVGNRIFELRQRLWAPPLCDPLSFQDVCKRERLLQRLHNLEQRYQRLWQRYRLLEATDRRTEEG
jgi:hypothetical protein